MVKQWVSMMVVACAIQGLNPAFARYEKSELDSAQTPDERQIRDLRNQEINQLRIALGRRLPQNRQADLYFRLAEIYLEAYRAEFLLEGRVFDQHLSQGRKEKTIDRDASKEHLRSGVKACEEIIHYNIPYPKLDGVYYFLAVYQGELGEDTASQKTFELITQRFPNSQFVSEAYREIGDAAYTKGDFKRAQALYETALKKETGEGVPRTLHKLAWTYYRTRQYDRAVSSMKEAITRAGTTGEKMLSLREEALRDMAVFMTETKRSEEAISYFQSVAGDKSYFPKLLERLGAQYERSVQPDRASEVYEMLLATKPTDEAAFRVLVKLVELDLRRGRLREALQRLKGHKVPTKGETETLVAASNLRAMVRRTATDSHETFRKNGSLDSLEVAEFYYTAYLDPFVAASDPRNEKPEILMYLADVKRELGKSKEASAYYRQVLDTGDRRYVKEAGALWTASLSEAIRKESANRASTGTALAEGGPSEVEREFISASDQMQKSLGDQAEGREAALKAAQVVAGYRHTQPEAIDRSKKIISRNPRSVQALTAARLWVQIYADQLPDPKATKGLREAVDELRANKLLLEADESIGGGKLAALLTVQDKNLKVGEIAGYERNKDYFAAAKGYEAFAATSNAEEIASKAYGSAVAAYTKGGDLDSSGRVLDAWMTRYPQSKVASEQARSTATQALIMGRFEAAATIFERFGKMGGSSDSLKTSARIFQGAGNLARARENWNSFLKIYPKLVDRFGISLLLAQSYQTERQGPQAIPHLRICMNGSPEQEAECGSHLADQLLLVKDVAQAKKILKKVAAIKGKSLSPYVAYARHRLAVLMEEEAEFKTPLQLPEKQLQKALAERLQFFEALSKAHFAAVEAGGPWGVASLDRLANWALEFANDVENINPPAKGGSVSPSQFQKSLVGVSEPLRAKAIETWSNAYQNAVRSEVLSPALPSIGDHLADARMLKPMANFPLRAQGVRARLRISGVPADGGPEGRSAALERVRERLTQNPKDAQGWVDYGNLLWGEGKPLLSGIAYERALDLDPQSAPALNNRAVVLLSGNGEEDWFRVAEGQALFKQALKKDPQFLASTMNLATLLNYFRIFSRAKVQWDLVVARLPSADAYDGLGIAQQGLGNQLLADAAFSKAKELGAKSNRFTRLYHEAAKQAPQGAGGAEKCYSTLAEMEDPSLGGFEKSSVDYLRKACKLWKND